MKQKRRKVKQESAGSAKESKRQATGAALTPKRFHGAVVSLSDALRRNKLILVIGAGVSQAANLPSWDSLIEPLRIDLRLPKPGPGTDPRLTDPLYIAEMYEQRSGKRALRSKIVEQLSGAYQPTRLHEILVELDLRTIFTTNYDRLLEKAFEKIGKSIFVVSRDSDYSYQPSEEITTLIKLHGDLMSPSEIVITKSDMLDYPRTHPNILQGFKDKLKTHTALFIGVSLLDLNLETFVEQSLRDLRGNEIRHYILVKDWHESLIEYYRLHSLEPVALAAWSQTEDFLLAIQDLAKQKSSKVGVQGGLLEASGLSSIESSKEISNEALKGFQAEYNTLLDMYRRGGRESVRGRAQALWDRLEKRQEHLYRNVKIETLLLLVRLWVQTPYRSEANFSKGQHYFNIAEDLAEDRQREDLLFTRAIFEYSQNNPQKALSIVDQISGEAALKIRIAVLLEMEKPDEVRFHIPEASKKSRNDAEWAWLVAQYYVSLEEYESALAILEPLLQLSPSDPEIVHLAGYILSAKAQQEQKKFCKNHGLLENVSIILFHEELIDRVGARKASDLFVKAAQLFSNLGETLRASRCLGFSFQLLQMCKASPQELSDLAQKLWDQSPEKLESKIKLISDSETLRSLNLEVFRDLLRSSDYFAYVLIQLREWTHIRGTSEEAARLLDEANVRDKFNSVEQQVMLSAVAAEFWQDCGRLDKAINAIDRFSPPVEYAYYPMVIRAAHYIFAKEDKTAAEIVSRLEDVYPNNPVVLALACQWYELNSDWNKMLEASGRLIKSIETVQTYEYYLIALGNLQHWILVLETLDRATIKGIELGPRWSHVNKSRALIALERDEDALKILEEAKAFEETSKSQQSISFVLSPEDLLNLVDVYIRTGKRDRAIVEAQSLVQRYPEFSSGHKAFVQLLREADRWEEAFEAAQQAADLFPYDDVIQVMYIDIASMSGHGDSVSELRKTFHERFPESSALRTVPVQKAFEELHKIHERGDYARHLYRIGFITGIHAAYMQGPSPSFYRFWQACTRLKTGVFVACGEQKDEWKLLEGCPERATAVFDFPALITAFELEEALGHWLGLLKQTFHKIYLPESFRKILTLESSSLLGQIQIGRYQSLKALRNLIDSDVRFTSTERILLPTEGEKVLPDEQERSFAASKNLLYFNEYGEDSERMRGEFGFQELAVFLSALGRLTPAQQNKLERLSRERDFKPLPLTKEALQSVVVDLRTLEVLHEVDLLETILPHFERIYISESKWLELVGEIHSMEFTEEIAQRFLNFERFIRGNEGWFEWVGSSDHERAPFLPLKAIEIGRHLTQAELYMSDLFAVAKKKNSFLVTDDRITRMLSFRQIDREDAAMITRIGSDSVLRYFRFRTDDPVDAEVYVSHYRQLIDWMYLHLPIDLETVVSMWPKGAGDHALGTDSPIYYFHRSMSHLLNAISENRILRGKLFAKVTTDYNHDMSLMLREAYKEGRSPEDAGEFFKALALPFMSQKLKDHAPEGVGALLTLLVNIENKIERDESSIESSGFFLWLDSVFYHSGIDPEDVDLGWQYYIHRLMDVTFPPEHQEIEKKYKSGVIARLLHVLPDRTTASILASNLGKILSEAFGWDLDLGPAYSWSVRTEEETREVIISLKQIEKLIQERLPKFMAKGSKRETGHGVAIFSDERDPGSFVLTFHALPLDQQMIEGPWKPVVRVINILDYFDFPDPKTREAAWQTGKDLLESLNKDLEFWGELKQHLLDPSEAQWKSAACHCRDCLLSDQEAAVHILLESFPLGPEFMRRVLSRIHLRHVHNWFHFSSVRWKTVEDLQIWAKSVGSGTGTEDWNKWGEQRKMAFHSIFPDARVFRRLVAGSILAAPWTSYKELSNIIQGLLDEAINNLSSAYKINTILTILDIIEAAPKTRHIPQRFLWEEDSDSDASTSVRMRLTEMLENVLSEELPAGSDTATENEIQALPRSLSAALSSLWQSDERPNHPEMRRYLACVIGGYLATTLYSNERNRSPHHWREFRQELLDLARENEWIAPDRKGFYRPSLARTISYGASFAVKALTLHTDSVRDHLISQDLRMLLLFLGRRHKFFHTLLWGNKPPDSTVLDSELSTSSDAGIKDFLEKIAGPSMKYWTSEERAKLGALYEDIDPYAELLLYYDRITGGANEENPELLFMSLLIGLRFAYIADRPEWLEWVEKCTSQEFIERLQVYIKAYQTWLLSLSQLLLVPQLTASTKNKVCAWLLRSADQFQNEDIPEVHIEAISMLLLDRWYPDHLDDWLLALAETKTLSFPVRRKIFHKFVQNSDHFSVEIRGRLISVFSAISDLPEWNTSAEFMTFSRRTDGTNPA